MQRPTLTTALAVAVLLSVGTALLYLLLTELYEPLRALHLTLSGAGDAYVLHLLCLRRTPAARVVLAMLVLGTTVLALCGSDSLWLSMGTSVGWIWLVRAISAYRTPLAIWADAGLCLLSSGLAVSVGLATGSVVLAVWCFFLVQSLWVCLPERLSFFGKTYTTKGSGFEEAAAAASEALQQLRN